MPSIEESKRQVKEALNSQPPDLDHDTILASLQDEIDRHNGRAGEDDNKQPSLKFRFKSGTPDPRKRKHRSRKENGDHSSRRKRQHRVAEDEQEQDTSDAAHPFPREPNSTVRPESYEEAFSGHTDSNTAFRESLFDALADDEGAAYWESVYSQPIHVYPRPSVVTDGGKSQEMTDEEYVVYVQTKMWEKKNPHIVLERARKAKQRKEEEEERARRREEFVRRKERAAWEKSQQEGARRFAGLEDDDEQESHEFVFDFGNAEKRFPASEAQEEFRDAWLKYTVAWDRLKVELLNARDSGSLNSYCSKDSAKRIPWPVLASKPVTKPNIDEFMKHMPVDADRSRLQQLKAERVKWHPDKIQQRFAGHVDEGTMKIVTGVFQVVDSLFEVERKLSHG